MGISENHVGKLHHLDILIYCNKWANTHLLTTLHVCGANGAHNLKQIWVKSEGLKSGVSAEKSLVSQLLA